MQRKLNKNNAQLLELKNPSDFKLEQKTYVCPFELAIHIQRAELNEAFGWSLAFNHAVTQQALARTEGVYTPWQQKQNKQNMPTHSSQDAVFGKKFY